MSTEDDVGRVKKVMQALKGEEERMPTMLETKITLTDEQIRDAISMYMRQKMFPHIPAFWFRTKFSTNASHHFQAEIVLVGYKNSAPEKQATDDLNEAEKKFR